MTRTTDEAAAAFIERVGLAIEQQGQPRIAGRILGRLLVCDPPYQSFDELVSALGASKGSISNMTRLLIHVGLVEKHSLPGDRRTYFRISPGAWQRVFRKQFEHARRLSDLAAEGLNMLENDSGKPDDRLREMHDFYEFVAGLGPDLIEAYSERRAAEREAETGPPPPDEGAEHR